MKKIRIKIGELFEKININEIDSLHLINGLYIMTPSGDLTQIRGLIKKSPQKIFEYELSNKSIVRTSENHLFLENGIIKKASECKYIDTTTDKLKITKSKFYNTDYVYDISIDSPHLYVTPNNIIHHNTSLMNVIVKELDVETLRINGSKDNGIDDMRYTIGGFANSMSISGNKKLVCVDEADYLTINAQSTLRTDLEVYSRNARFIFTGNYPDKLIQPLLDRLQIFNLDDIYAQHKKELGKYIFERLSFILQNENVTYDNGDVLEVIKKFYPSTRSMIMFIQQNTTNNVLKFTDIKNSDDVFAEIIESLKDRKFNDVKSKVDELLVPDNLYTYLWKNMDNIFEIQSQPSVIVLLAEYQDYSQKARNKHIPLMAMLVKIMSDSSIKFKS